MSLMSRRTMLLAMTGLGASCLVPGIALAEEGSTAEEFNGEEGNSEIYVGPVLSPEDADLLLRAKAEQEAKKVIAEAEAAFDAENPLGARSSRPTYSTVYGASQTVWTGVREVAGQGQWGSCATTESYIYAALSGGGTMSVTIAFGTPFGSLGVSLPLSKKTTAALAGVSMALPADGHWYKMCLDMAYDVKPYAVYETKNGKKTLYKTNCVKTYNGVRISKKRTK